MRIIEWWSLAVLIFLCYCFSLDNNNKPKYNNVLLWKPKDDDDQIASRKIRAAFKWLGTFLLIAFVDKLVSIPKEEAHQVVDIASWIYLGFGVLVFVDYLYKRWSKKTNR